MNTPWRNHNPSPIIPCLLTPLAGCIPNYRPSAICPFTPCKKDPLNRHQPIACNPENPQKSCKSCFRQRPQEIWDRPRLRGASQIIVPLQSAPFTPRKEDPLNRINRSPAIPKIPNNPVNPASDNPSPKTWDTPPPPRAKTLTTPTKSSTLIPPLRTFVRADVTFPA